MPSSASAVLNISGGTFQQGISVAGNSRIYGDISLNISGSPSFSSKDVTCGNTMLNGNASINISDSNITNANRIFAGPTQSENTYVNITDSSVTCNVYGGANSETVYGDSAVIIDGNSTLNTVYGGGNGGKIAGESRVYIKDGTVKTVYGGGNSGKVVNSQIYMTGGHVTDTLYGGCATGNVLDGNTFGIKVFIHGGTVKNVYGGCFNLETDIGAYLDLQNCTVTGTVYAGGEKKRVKADCYMYVSNTVLNGNGGILPTHNIKLGKITNGLLNAGLINVKKCYIYYEPDTTHNFGKQFSLWENPERLEPRLP